MNRLQRICLPAFALACGCAAVAGVAFLHSSADGGQPDFGAVTLETEYACGETLDLPAVTATLNGKSYATESAVYFPDGTATKTNEVVLGQAGSYRVEYRFETGGKLYVEEYSFDAVKSLYDVSGEGSVSYGKDESAHQTGTTGLRLSLTDGDVFTYSKIVDLNRFSSDESVISLFMLPQKNGTMDAQIIYVTFTDAYDPENYVTVLCQGSEDTTATWGYITGYMMAAANGQVQIGLEGDTVHRGNGYGKPIRFSFYGMSGESVAAHPMTVAFDLAEKIVYGPDRGGRMIVDLDDLAYEKFAWEGFTTGEVYVSVSAGNFKSASVDLMITDIAGDPLDGDYVRDTEGPVVSVDESDFVAGAAPEGIVGCAYPIFEACALDSYSGERTVSTRVFYNYYSSNRYELDIRNGFIPTRAGSYTIEYTASDAYGNVSRALVAVTVQPSSEPLTIELGEKETTGKKGVAASLAEASVSGGVGSGYSLTVTVSHNGEQTETTDGTFIPLNSGTYTVLYTATDYVGQTATLSYTVEVEDNRLPVFWDEPLLPAYFIEGYTYVLPRFAAYDCADGFKEIAASVTAKDGGAERDAATSYIPVKGADGMAIITYTATNVAGSVTVTREIPVVSVTDADGNLDLVSYFMPYGGGSVVYNADSACMVLRASTSDGGFTFVNPLLADGFALQCNVNSKYKNFGKLSFILTDYEDRNVSVKISFVQGAQYTRIEVNGKTLSMTLASDYLTSGSKRNFIYDNDTRIFSQGSIFSFAIDNCENGAAFTGFPSEKFYLSVAFEGVTGASRLRMYRLSGQTLSAEEDYVQPGIKILGEYEPLVDVGTTVTVYPAVTADVLDPYATGTLSVVDPEGNYLVCDGITLKDADMTRTYTFKAELYGMYVISYTVRDGSDNGRAYAYSVTVLDRTPPEFTLTETLKTSYSVGEKLVMPGYEATDNLGGSVRVICSLTLPNGTRATAVNGTTLSVAGTYTLTYIVADESGNFVMREYKLTVK